QERTETNSEFGIRILEHRPEERWGGHEPIELPGVIAQQGFQAPRIEVGALPQKLQILFRQMLEVTKLVAHDSTEILSRCGVKSRFAPRTPSAGIGLDEEIPQRAVRRNGVRFHTSYGCAGRAGPEPIDQLVAGFRFSLRPDLD